MGHLVRFSEAFQLLDLGSKSSEKTQKSRREENRTGSKIEMPALASNPFTENKNNPDTLRQGRISLCLSPPRRKEGIRHWLDGCDQTRSEERQNFLRKELPKKKRMVHLDQQANRRVLQLLLHNLPN